MAAMKKPSATRKPAVTVPGYKSTGVKVPVAKTATPKASVKPKASPKPSPVKTLPSLAEYKQSAAYKTGSMTYKQYLEVFKARGYK